MSRAPNANDTIARAKALLRSYETAMVELEAELAELQHRLATSIEMEDVMAIEFNYRHFMDLLRRKKLLDLLQEDMERENSNGKRDG